MDDFETFEHNGKRYVARIESDDTATPPWKGQDGHGPVSDWTRRKKNPGELILAEDNGNRLFYDFAAAVKIAKADAWDSPPFGQGTKGQRAARAAMADFEYLRKYANGIWNYIGVIVHPICQCCGTAIEGKSESLWGIESDGTAYIRQVARELAEQLES